MNEIYAKYGLDLVKIEEYLLEEIRVKYFNIKYFWYYELPNERKIFTVKGWGLKSINERNLR